MSNTFYIDANRANSSVKSNDTNAEWEYKLSNNIQIPAGSEIAVEEVFLHKQGISGATIEIDEDITETLYFSVYLSDNPHFVPKSTHSADSRTYNSITKDKAYVPSFMPFGILNQRGAYNALATGTNSTPYFGQEFSMHRILASEAQKHNGSKYYGMPNAAQRIALFEDDGGANIGKGNNPRLQGGEFNNLNDPYISGYSEYPMMAVFVDKESVYWTQDNDLDFGAGIGLRGDGTARAICDRYLGKKEELGDNRFKPYVKSVDILIKKGVYSIGEISTLIENQINGKYINVKNDDLYTDTIIDKQNKQTYTGTLETDGIYTKVQALDRYSKKQEQQLFADGTTDFSQGTTNFSATPRFGSNGAVNFQEPVDDLKKVFSRSTAYGGTNQKWIDNKKIATTIRYGSDKEPQQMFPHFNPSGFPGFHWAGFNDNYGSPYYPFNMKCEIQYYETGNGTAGNGGLALADVDKVLLAYDEIPEGGASRDPFDVNFPEETSIQGTHKGRVPILPTEQELFYIPVHYYNQLVKMWIYEDFETPDLIAGIEEDTRAHGNSYLFETGNWTVNTRRMFRYGFQTRCNSYGKSTAPPNGLDCSDNDNFIGLHYVGKVNAIPDIFITGEKNSSSQYPCNQEEKLQVEVSPAQFQYDIFEGGYYVGTPDFQFTYDTDQSSFIIKGLHQAKRIPSCDMQGNPMVSEGETAVYVRRQAKALEDLLVNPNRSEAILAELLHDIPDKNHWNAEQKNYEAQYEKSGGKKGFADKIRSVLNNNEDRVGGVAIYNWAYQTAIKYGDIDPTTFMEKNLNNHGVPYKKYNQKYKYLWKFQDFFSNEQKARESWEKTLWFKLGFTYDNLQNTNGWEKCPYYDLPVDKYTNTASKEALATNDLDTINASERSNTYYETRNKMFFKNEDFVLYGKTTKGEIDLSSVSSISSTFNNLLYSYDERPVSGKVQEVGKHAGTIQQLIRTYDNTNVSKPYWGNIAGSTLFTFGVNATGSFPNGNPRDNLFDDYTKSCAQLQYEKTTQPMQTAGLFDVGYSFDNSVYVGKTRIPVLTDSKSIIATKLPQLSQQGYYIITSDIVDNYMDDMKQGQPLPMLGLVPISNLSNQDFITGGSDITHITQQVKNLNSIKIKILNPDLTRATLNTNSSVILRITCPLPENTPMTGKKEAKDDKEKIEQNSPHDNKTKSGRI